MILSLRDITRRQRARVYSAALSESLPTFAFEAAQDQARRLGLPLSDASRLAEAALHYGLACHGLLNDACCRVANRSLAKGVISSPQAVIRMARREERREAEAARRATGATLAQRLARTHGCGGSV